jgi:dolichol-phosphate mannosyltransferase
LSEEYLTEMKEFRVALIIPTLNERDNIVGLFQAVRGILPKAQIVIVDDNSPDGTGKVSDDLASRDKLVHVLHRRGKRGLGLAYKEAFTYVLNNLDSEYIFEMDADFSHNPRYLALFLYYAREFPIVTGSRFLKKVSIQDRTVWRNIISVSSKAMVNLMLGLNLTDVTTGFKCFNRMALQDIDLTQVRSRGFVFQMEIAYMAQRRGMRVKEIPILFVERKAGKSKMRPKTVLEGICILLYLVFCRITGRR